MSTNQFKRLLPVLAVIGAAMFLATLILSERHQQAFLVDTGETRADVLRALNELAAQHPTTIDDESFRQSVRELPGKPYVVSVWLFAPDGQVVESPGFGGSYLGGGARANEMASLDVRGALDAIPDDVLTDAQRTMLLAASHIRAEGTHNDIFRHLVVPISAPDGTPVAFVGTSFGVTHGAHDKMGVATFAVGGLARLGGFLLYWLSLPLWVYLDATQRGNRAWLWATFVFFGNLVGLLAYLLTQPLPQGSAADPAHALS